MLLACVAGATAQERSPLCVALQAVFPDTTCTDYDGDNDGLIDVRNVAQLAAITHDLTGAGNASAAAYTNAFPDALSGMGCLLGSCSGYELLNDITLSGNWTPIGGGASLANIGGQGADNVDASLAIRYNAIFEGNGHVIRGLRLNLNVDSNHQGLFRALGTNGRIRNVGLVDVRMIHDGDSEIDNIGSLVGFNAGKVAASYALGDMAVEHAMIGTAKVGGLVGDNKGTIIASYANMVVRARGRPGGGLAGRVRSDGKIIASYALGRVSPQQGFARVSENQYGGLVGLVDSGGQITNSYSSRELSELTWRDGRGVNVPSSSLKTSGQLRAPTSTTGIYAAWQNLNVDDKDNDLFEGTALNDDNPWIFGNCSQFPVLDASAASETAQRAAQPPILASLSRHGDGQIIEGSRAMYAVELNSCSPSATLLWEIELTGSGGGHAIHADFEGGTVGGQITITNASRGVFGVPIARDAARERRESFRVKLRLPTGATGLALGNPNAVVSFIASSGQNYDADGDGLIEVTTAPQLAAITYDLNGAGITAMSDTDALAYEEAFAFFDQNLTCPEPAGCTGYELMNDIALSSTWTPIGRGSFSGVPEDPPAAIRYEGTFEGNGHVIQGLVLRDPDSDNDSFFIGLFAALGAGGVIRNVGLLNADVILDGANEEAVGSLVGHNSGKVAASYAAGGGVYGGRRVGGLVGDNKGEIIACYASAHVRGLDEHVGGLAGRVVGSGGDVIASYALGRVQRIQNTDPNYGGLVGSISGGRITNSYFVPEVSGANTNGVNVPSSARKMRTDLHGPTTASGIYEDWVGLHVDDTSSTVMGVLTLNDDAPWDFGTTIDYPVLRGTSASVANVARQFSLQPQVELQAVATGAATVVEGDSAEYTVSAPVVLPYATTAHWSVGAAPGSDGVQAGDFADVGGMRLSGFPSGTAVIQAGSSRTTFSVHVFDDPDAELRERFVVSVRGVADAGAMVVFDAESVSTAVTSIELSDGNDHDGDNDGLIDVATTSQLAAIRYDLGGRGLAGVSETGRNKYLAAFDVFDQVKTCPTTNMCSGYELLNDLDLSGTNWTPIGGGDPTVEYYSAVFEGNGYVISSMTIARSSLNRAGLFGAVSSVGTIRNVGLRDVNVAVGSDDSFTGTLVGENAGKVAASYVAGGGVTGGWSAGGLMGVNRGVVIASYADVKVNAVSDNSGGLIGEAAVDSVVSASYSVGVVQSGGAKSGGLVGQRNNSNAGANDVQASYYDRGRSVQTMCCGLNTPSNDAGTSRTSAELRAPTAAMGIYAGWDKLNVDGADQGGDNDLNDDAPWDFGGPFQYPVLVFGGDAGRVAARRTSQQEAQPVLILTSTLVGSERVSEDATATYVVSLERSLPPGVSASWRWIVGLGGAITAGDFRRTTGPVVIAAGSSSGSFSLGVRADGVPEPAEVFEVSLGDARLGGNADNASLRVPVSGVRTTIELSDPADYDGDNDGLIDVTTKEQLEAITYDLNGHGLAGVSEADRNDYLAAFEVFSTAKTCPTTNMCIGYELLNDVTLSGDWDPIGRRSFSGTHEDPPAAIRYEGIFEGNGHVIRGLRLSDPDSNEDDLYIGLFAALGARGVIRNVGLLDVSTDLSFDETRVGSLAGHNSGTVASSYVVGGAVEAGERVGGLVGDNEGVIIASYARVNTRGARDYIGGLAGRVGSGGDVIASYALGEMDRLMFTRRYLWRPGGGYCGWSDNEQLLCSRGERGEHPWSERAVIGAQDENGFACTDDGGRHLCRLGWSERGQHDGHVHGCIDVERRRAVGLWQFAAISGAASWPKQHRGAGAAIGSAGGAADARAGRGRDGVGRRHGELRGRPVEDGGAGGAAVGCVGELELVGGCRRRHHHR